MRLSLLLAALLATYALVGAQSRLGKLWKTLDADGNNFITKNDIALFTKTFQGHAASERTLNEAIKLLDMNMDGAIDYAEFESCFAPMLERNTQLANDAAQQVPEQVHISVTTQATEMIVMWVTRANTDSVVQYGTSSGNYAQSVSGTSWTYAAGVDGWIGWIHYVRLTGLAPSTRYFYRVGAPTAVWNQEYSFKTPPAPGSAQSNTFAVFGDMGTFMPLGWKVSEFMTLDNQVTPFDCIVHVGDIAYGGTGSTWEFEWIWDLFFWQVEPLAARVPYMVGVGNHEHYYDYASFQARFRMPSDQSNGNTNFWFSHDYGLVHWVYTSTEHNFTQGSPQWIWAQADLQKAVANRKNVPWIIFTGHRPFLNSDSSEYGDHNPNGRFLQAWEPLLLQYKVDMVLNGHMHMYERTFPTAHGNVDKISVVSLNMIRNPSAPVYMTQGTGGAMIIEKMIEPKPAWSAVREQLYGYGRMTVFNSTHMFYEYRSYETQGTHDNMWLIQENH